MSCFLQGNWKMGTCRPDTRSLLGDGKSLADGSSIMNIYDALYIGEAAAEQKLERKYPLYKDGTVMLVVCYSDASQTIPIGAESFSSTKQIKPQNRRSRNSGPIPTKRLRIDIDE